MKKGLGEGAVRPEQVSQQVAHPPQGYWETYQKHKFSDLTPVLMDQNLWEWGFIDKTHPVFPYCVCVLVSPLLLTRNAPLLALLVTKVTTRILCNTSWASSRHSVGGHRFRTQSQNTVRAHFRCLSPVGASRGTPNFCPIWLQIRGSCGLPGGSDGEEQACNVGDLVQSWVFSSESALHIRWPKYWSFSFSISPSNEHPGLSSFRMDWLDLLAVQGPLKSLL